MATQSKANGKVPIAPQAALNETVAMNQYLLNRNLLLAQQVHELTSTVEALRAESEAKKGKG